MKNTLIELFEISLYEPFVFRVPVKKTFHSPPKNQLLFPSANRPRLSAFVPLSVAVKREGGRILIN